jgi:hypothetical protein
MLRGRYTMRSVNINAPVDGVRPNAAFGDITQFQSTGRTQSDRLTIQANFRYVLRQQQSQFRFSYQLGQEKNFADSATSLPTNNLNPMSIGARPARTSVIDSRPRAPCLWFMASESPRTSTSSRACRTTRRRVSTTTTMARFNDRPFGVTRNSLRGDWTWGLNLNVNKRINLGRLPTAATPGGPRATR